MGDIGCDGAQLLRLRSSGAVDRLCWNRDSCSSAIYTRLASRTASWVALSIRPVAYVRVWTAELFELVVTGAVGILVRVALRLDE